MSDHDLNERIAEHVWKRIRFVRPDVSYLVPESLYAHLMEHPAIGWHAGDPADKLNSICTTFNDYQNYTIPRFDKDANAALTLIAALEKEGWIMNLDNDAGIWTCMFHKLDVQKMEAADAMPMAVALAFLAVKEAGK